MKVCDITIYVNDLGACINYTAIMTPGGYVGKGSCPQEALSQLPEAAYQHILKHPQSTKQHDIEAAEHWLCDEGQRFAQWRDSELVNGAGI